MKKATRPLVAVIETSDADRLDGRQPVMTSIRPMNRIMAWIYNKFSKPISAGETARQMAHTLSVEYVVEIDPPLLAKLMGAHGKRNAPVETGDGHHIRLVLTPSMAAKSVAAINNRKDVRP